MRWRGGWRGGRREGVRGRGERSEMEGRKKLRGELEEGSVGRSNINIVSRVSHMRICRHRQATAKSEKE